VGALTAELKAQWQTYIPEANNGDWILHSQQE